MEEEFQKGFGENTESQSLPYDENVNTANENTQDAHTQHMDHEYGGTDHTWKEYTDSTYEKKQQGESDTYTRYSGGGYQNSGYQNNGYRNQTNTGYPPQQSQGFGLASMIMGIVSLVMFCSCINIPLAITAIVFGVIQLSRTGNQKKGMAIAGIVTSVLSIVMFVFIIGITMFGFRSEVRHGISSDMYEEFFDDLYVTVHTPS